MPTYDYRCDENDRVVEVHHRMNQKIHTWGELCEVAGIDPGDVDQITPVTRLANGGNVVKSSSLKNSVPAGCNPEACCGGGNCMLNG